MTDKIKGSFTDWAPIPKSKSAKHKPTTLYCGQHFYYLKICLSCLMSTSQHICMMHDPQPQTQQHNSNPLHLNLNSAPLCS